MVCRQHVALTNTAYWCDPVRSGEITLPMAQLSKVQEAFLLNANQLGSDRQTNWALPPNLLGSGAK